MHDLHLANKIFNLILEQVKKNNLKKVCLVTIELGTIVEHGEIINSENLVFLLKNFSRGTIASNAEFKIKKVVGDNFWKLEEIVGN